MPNTPVVVGKGASAIAGGSNVTSDDLAWAESILGAVGIVVRVSERIIDAVTGLSGPMPAYLYLVIEALIEAGVHQGLSREVSRDLVVATFEGSAALLAESGDSPEVLRAQVTSPGGTTAAGLRVLESHAVRAAFLDAVSGSRRTQSPIGSLKTPPLLLLHGDAASSLEETLGTDDCSPARLPTDRRRLVTARRSAH